MVYKISRFYKTAKVCMFWHTHRCVKNYTNEDRSMVNRSIHSIL